MECCETWETGTCRGCRRRQLLHTDAAVRRQAGGRDRASAAWPWADRVSDKKKKRASSQAQALGQETWSAHGVQRAEAGASCLLLNGPFHPPRGAHSRPFWAPPCRTARALILPSHQLLTRSTLSSYRYWATFILFCGIPIGHSCPFVHRVAHLFLADS